MNSLKPSRSHANNPSARHRITLRGLSRPKVYQVINPPTSRDGVQLVEDQDGRSLKVVAEDLQNPLIDAFTNETVGHILMTNFPHFSHPKKPSYLFSFYLTDQAKLKTKVLFELLSIIWKKLV